MTEFEQQLLQHLQNHGELLAALSLSQSQTTAALLTISTQQSAILGALAKEPSGESLESTLKAALQPLESSLDKLVTSFNSLSGISQGLSKQLPPQPKQ